MAKNYKEVKVTLKIQNADRDAVYFLKDTIQRELWQAGWCLSKDDILVEVPVNA